MLSTPVARCGDTSMRHWAVVAVSFAIQAAAAAGITVALLTDSPLALTAAFTVATIPVPDCVASLLVHHARTPSQLADWNVTRSFAMAGGSLVGSLLAAAAVSRRHVHGLSTSVTLGAALLTLPLTMIGQTTWLTTVLALSVVLGIGNDHIEIERTRFRSGRAQRR